MKTQFSDKTNVIDAKLTKIFYNERNQIFLTNEKTYKADCSQRTNGTELM